MDVFDVLEAWKRGGKGIAAMCLLFCLLTGIYCAQKQETTASAVIALTCTAENGEEGETAWERDPQIFRSPAVVDDAMARLGMRGSVEEVRSRMRVRARASQEGKDGGLYEVSYTTHGGRAQAIRVLDAVLHSALACYGERHTAPLTFSMANVDALADASYADRAQAMRDTADEAMAALRTLAAEAPDYYSAQTDLSFADLEDLFLFAREGIPCAQEPVSPVIQPEGPEDAAELLEAARAALDEACGLAAQTVKEYGRWKAAQHIALRGSIAVSQRLDPRVYMALALAVYLILGGTLAVAWARVKAPGTRP